MLTFLALFILLILVLVGTLRTGELSVTAAILDNVTSESFGVAAQLVSQTTGSPKFIEGRLSVTTSEVAIPLSPLTGTLGYAIFQNLDAANFVELRVSTGSTKFAKLKAGEFMVFRFGSGVTAPYIIADTATVLVRYRIYET